MSVQGKGFFKGELFSFDPTVGGVIPGDSLPSGVYSIIAQKPGYYDLLEDQIVHNSKIVDFGIIKSIKDKRGELPHVSKEYLENLNKVKMFILGAGSLYGSQLAQLAIPGVVDTLVARKDKIRKVPAVYC